jgi:putative DNA primase/helicase
MSPLEVVASWAADLEQKPVSVSNGVSPPIGGFDVDGFTRRHGLEVREHASWKHGEKWVLEICPFKADHKGGCAVITRDHDGRLGFRCLHDSCAGKGWHEFRALFENSANNGIFLRTRTTPTAENAWPDPVPFQARPVPAISADILPGFLGDMVDAIAKATETPVALPALLGLSVASASVAKKIIVSPEPGYVEPANTYTAVVMESGNRKSAVLTLMTKPLMEWEQAEALRLTPEHKRIRSDRKTQELRIEHLRKKAARTSNNSALKIEIAELEASLPDLPQPPRLWVQDITPERMAGIMAEQGERMALLSDEGGIFDILAGRYSGNIPNLDLFLQAHSGSPVRVDRTDRSKPPINLRNPCLTVGISPQPDVFHSLTDKPGFRGRGLLARFLYALPVSPLGTRTLIPAPVSPAVEGAYRSGIERLLSLSPPVDDEGTWQPWRLELSPQAYQAWKEFQRSIESLMREGGKLDSLRDWASKLPGAVARIAAVFHCVISEPAITSIIEVDTIQRAIHLATLLIDHALAVVGLMERDPVIDDALKILGWIRRQSRPSFTVRECFCAHQARFKKVDNIRGSLHLLEEHGYIRPGPKEKVPYRPSEVFEVNPTALETDS